MTTKIPTSVRIVLALSKKRLYETVFIHFLIHQRPLGNGTASSTPAGQNLTVKLTIIRFQKCSEWENDAYKEWKCSNPTTTEIFEFIERKYSKEKEKSNEPCQRVYHWKFCKSGTVLSIFKLKLSARLKLSADRSRLPRLRFDSLRAPFGSISLKTLNKSLNLLCNDNHTIT